MNHDDLLKIFAELYGESVQAEIFFAPGRVNLIGDHTDYNGGLVFPCGVNMGTTLVVTPSEDDYIEMTSLNFEPSFKVHLSEISGKGDNLWSNYPLGVLNEFSKKGIPLKGLKCLYYGDLPAGSGLSSSASIEVVTAFAVNSLLNCQLDLVELVKISQAAERNFVGVQCGIMDQFAVAKAEANHGIKLDCASLDYEAVPIDLGDYQILLVNSNQERELANSAYNQRTQECAAALEYFQKHFKTDDLASVSPQQFKEHAAGIGNDTLLRRSRHVVTEHNRVIEAVDALNAGDLTSFGSLMSASHKSLKEDYEVSTEALDFLVDEALAFDGVLGSRLTGAGFGGCTVNLVKKSQVEPLRKQLAAVYKSKFGTEADFYPIEIGGGVRKIS